LLKIPQMTLNWVCSRLPWLSPGWMECGGRPSNSSSTEGHVLGQRLHQVLESMFCTPETRHTKTLIWGRHVSSLSVSLNLLWNLDHPYLQCIDGFGLPPCMVHGPWS
jgi:hypothetical protein